MKRFITTGVEWRIRMPGNHLGTQTLDLQSDRASEPLLKMRGISKLYPGVQALRNVDLELRQGEVVALIGENGAGKSTLLKILAGATTPDAGELHIDGELVAFQGPGDAEKLGIATVYQEFNLFQALTVAENVLFHNMPRRFGVIDWARARELAQTYMDRVGTGIDVSRRVAELSVAERQMVEIAKALARDARVLVLDEPTAVLGGSDVDELFRIVRDLRADGVGVIFVSHRLEEVFGLADRFVVLKDGELAGQGDVGDADHDSLVSMMVGRELDQASHRVRSSIREEALLQVEGLCRHGVFEDISFTVNAGEVVGLAGLRGAGRTEVARAIFGADPLDEGRILLHGAPVRIGSPGRAVARGIGLVPEERKTQGILTNLSTPPNISLARTAKTRRLLAFPRGERRIADRHIRDLGIRIPRVDQPTIQLSGGNQQKVVLAKWLEADVSVLILDEPTRGIDVGAKAEVYETIRDLCAQGIGVLLISSELPEVLALSDRILVMYRGRITAELPAAEASEERIASYAVGGARA
jgi:ABC-type sugar transport system ATPase subunit